MTTHLSDLDEVVRQMRVVAEPDDHWLTTLANTIEQSLAAIRRAFENEARYLWLRDKAWSMPAIAQQELPAVAIFSGSGRRCKDVSGNEMDQAVDAAMKEQTSSAEARERE